MNKFDLWQIDAFTTTRLGGNPCAVVFDADPLATEMMQSIAREMNLSETAFVIQSGKADFGARYFTPAEEIPLAGHPTISTIHALIERGAIDIKKTDSVTLELPAGVIRIDILPKPDAPHIIMSQKRPEFLDVYDPAEVAPVFGLSQDELMPGAKIQTVSTGTPQLMIPIRNHECLRKAMLNVLGYCNLRERGDFFSPHLFCLGGVTAEGDTFARHFGTPPDLFEDPFTGSATGGMCAYLWRYGLIDSPHLTVEQGHWMNRPGSAQVEVVGPADDISTVKVGGQAVTVMKGELMI
jgi:trans-2,3-dihydro-3-hydroxyanthranilate isomerase